MGLGPRRVVDNQGKVRSGSAYFPFTVPLAAGTQPRRHGLIAGAPLRPGENHLRRCRSAWVGYPPIDWFGSYDRTSGLSARLLLRKPANEGSERDFQVSAKRRFERLSSSIDTLESGND